MDPYGYISASSTFVPNQTLGGGLVLLPPLCLDCPRPPGVPGTSVLASCVSSLPPWVRKRASQSTGRWGRTVQGNRACPFFRPLQFPPGGSSLWMLPGLFCGESGPSREESREQPQGWLLWHGMPEPATGKESAEALSGSLWFQIQTLQQAGVCLSGQP